MDKIEKRIEDAYSKLGLREPFIAAVMTRIPRVVDPKTPTAATDGTVVKFGPDFVEKLDNAELFGLVLHEALHVVLMHMWRRGDRDSSLWNYANDAIINAYILSRGYSLPAGGVHVGWVTESMDSETVYKRLKKDEEENKAAGGGKPKYDAGGFDGKGDISDAPNEATKSDLEATIAAAAQMAKDCGHTSGLIESILKSVGKPSIDWRDELRALLTSAAANDYTYRRPSRRFISQGLYMPSLHSDALGGLLIAIDSSGSMSQKELSQIAAEVEQIKEDMNPEFIEVVYCDTQVKNTQRFDREDTVELKCTGGGGTRFRPVFDYLANMADKVEGLVYFTDMEGNLDECVEPECPVIWANTQYRVRSAPFGVVANVQV
jgi:predicted metal-dependent peptidase